MALRGSLSLVALAVRAACLESPCSDAWANCSETTCCSTPYYECVEKVPPGYKKDGKVVAAYAQCRFANKTAGKSSCPCANPPCVDWTHDYKDKVKVPWSCVVLTGGCSEAFKPCGPGKKLDSDQKKRWKGTPCCQWGCTCDYNQSWAAQCKPPEGMYACTKEAQKAKAIASAGGNRLFSLTDAVEAPTRTARVSFAPWPAAVAGAFLVLAGVAVGSWRRRGRSRAEAVADAEAEAGLD
eukprot:CAMPEP_0204608750 /NCGR_PEP_ID=MMETSP0661-20131031/60505_1 /ASSEMBLY_ACC=CAM_ASM_000606 /TAXON_ID=109239 /ORGANISM="Alexandrium margalefi, Strain AMGDE01CS-322" /LENGTH=238 /DNA_ID=CAMNT_0051620319 /DNA_START=63 /DNA_END=779 /DNA_ORIENTATION=+